MPLPCISIPLTVDFRLPIMYAFMAIALSILIPPSSLQANNNLLFSSNSDATFKAYAFTINPQSTDKKHIFLKQLQFYPPKSWKKIAHSNNFATNQAFKQLQANLQAISIHSNALFFTKKEFNNTLMTIALVNSQKANQLVNGIMEK